MPATTSNGISLYYESHGDGEPVLWIQGLGADRTAWLGQVSFFQRHYRCVAFDNRDAGRSEHVSVSYTVADMAGDAAGLIAALGLPPVHVVGLSLGGSVGQELALRYPDRVRTLTLVSSSARSDARLRTLLGVWPEIYRKAGLIDFYRQAMPWLFTYRFFERPRAVASLLRYVSNHPQPPDAFARQAAAGLDHDTTARLPLIDVPTLVVAGEEDILVPLRLSRALAEAIPAARIAIVREAAHAVNVEKSAAFNATLLPFLRDNASA